MPVAPASRRDRLRVQTLAEIRAHAWAQVDESGAHALSSNAIAKAMGMSGPAIYRYFDSRGALLAALVLEAYGDLTAALEDAAAANARKAPARRLDAVCAAYRAWALAHPRRYAMLFDQRPDDALDSAEAIVTIHRGMVVLLELLGELAASSPAPARAGRPDKLDQQLLAWARERAMPGDLPAHVLRAGVLTWSQLHGTVSLELAGPFAAMGLDAGLLIEAGVAQLTRV
ncbi:MAG: transcriptional regulator, TetR family [Conexibacter sp.]|nr:transcriptional regulator, TetR family [Conexibacter sp.]